MSQRLLLPLSSTLTRTVCPIRLQPWSNRLSLHLLKWLLPLRQFLRQTRSSLPRSQTQLLLRLRLLQLVPQLCPPSRPCHLSPSPHQSRLSPQALHRLHLRLSPLQLLHRNPSTLRPRLHQPLLLRRLQSRLKLLHLIRMAPASSHLALHTTLSQALGATLSARLMLRLQMISAK